MGPFPGDFESLQIHLDYADLLEHRDGQLLEILTQELPAGLSGRLRSIRHYDGQPIAAAAVTEPLLAQEAVCV